MTLAIGLKKQTIVPVADITLQTLIVTIGTTTEDLISNSYLFVPRFDQLPMNTEIKTLIPYIYNISIQGPF